MAALNTKRSSSIDSSCPDCSPFLNWDHKRFRSYSERALVVRSLVATLKFQPAPDISLEEKTMRFLKFVTPENGESADAFLHRHSSLSDYPSTEFIQSILVLLSSASHAITTAAMKLLKCVILHSSEIVQFYLVKADLIPQLINTLNPLSLSFTEAVDIHSSLMIIIANPVRLSTPYALRKLEIKDYNKQQAVHETVLKQVVAPSEKYIWHLCANHCSIVDGDQSRFFLELLFYLLEISAYYQPTMDFVVNMPVFLTIPSCLTLFENERTIWYFLYRMINAQREWNKQGGGGREMGKTVHKMLRMEGIEDVIEQKLQNDKNGDWGNNIVVQSIEWKGLLGMNLRK
ncbi:hypothetical protein BLNAU_13391 [Blattamonas nauphoetae]|uniref:Uncharacterized protein n=1 Tax=Blattamonas nauphoetae TaxID=2049346 RepID=A0ABQ9XGR1_9EUKA|nr:hypothetical protein BLNAU_13391 [Blattamonas nauphoetae]